MMPYNFQWLPKALRPPALVYEVYVVFLVGGSGTYSLVSGTVLSLWWAEPCQGVCLEVAVSFI